jgi:hypothetical protein
LQATTAAFLLAGIGVTTANQPLNADSRPGVQAPALALTTTPSATLPPRARLPLVIAPQATNTPTSTPEVTPSPTRHASITPRPPANYSLRFYGYGQNDADRVKIKLEAPARPIDVGGAFTLEFWMKAAPGENASGTCTEGGDSWINGNIIFDRDVYGPGDSGDYGIALYGGRIAFGAAVGNNGQTICAGSALTDNAWHHIAATRSVTGLLSVFVDGALARRAQGPAGDLSYRDGRSSAYPNSDPYLVIGAEKHDAGAAYPSFSGWLDEVRLSVAARYSTAFTPATRFTADAQTVALFHFDEGVGTSAADSSGAAGGPSNGVIQRGGPQNGPAWSNDRP